MANQHHPDSERGRPSSIQGQSNSAARGAHVCCTHKRYSSPLGEEGKSYGYYTRAVRQRQQLGGTQPHKYKRQYHHNTSGIRNNNYKPGSLRVSSAAAVCVSIIPLLDNMVPTARPSNDTRTARATHMAPRPCCSVANSSSSIREGKKEDTHTHFLLSLIRPRRLSPEQRGSSRPDRKSQRHPITAEAGFSE